MFVKTVFSALDTFDSAPVERMRAPCHLFVKRCLLVRICPEEARIYSVPVFFCAITPDQHIHEAIECFIRKLGIKEAGPLKFFDSLGYTEDVAFLTSGDCSRVVVAQIKRCIEYDPPGVDSAKSESRNHYGGCELIRQPRLLGGTTKFMEEAEEVHSAVTNRAPLSESHLFL